MHWETGWSEKRPLTLQYGGNEHSKLPHLRQNIRGWKGSGSNLEVEAVENLQLVSSVSSSTSQINANNVSSMNGKKPTSTLSLEAFRARKETNRSTFFRSSKNTNRPEKDLTIRIGVL